MKRTRPKTIGRVSLALAAAGLATSCGETEGTAEVRDQSSVESAVPPPTSPATASGHELCQPAETTGVDNTVSPEVTVGTVTRNPRGPQTAATLNDEVVTLTSTSERGIDLTGWTVEDDQRVSFTFPRESSICRYVVISIHSGQGTNTSKDFFADWGWRWDDHGDTVTLRDAEHGLVAECTYGKTAPSLHC